MFSLIVAIMAVILTAGIAVATIYYGGSNATNSGGRALAEQLINAGEHITSAGALYQNDHAGDLPASPSTGLAPYYLSSLPLPPQAVYAKNAGTASTADWQYLTGTADVVLPKLSTAACNSVNALYGLKAIPATLDTKYLIQCYGKSEPYTFYFDPPGGNMKQAAQIVSAPAVTGVSPATVAYGGGTTITISGSNFQSGATVMVGNQPATSVQVVNANTITAVTPNNPSGAYAVTVANAGGGSSSIVNAVTYSTVTFGQFAPAPYITLTDNNRTVINSNTTYASAMTSIGKSSGKWYWEFTTYGTGWNDYGATTQLPTIGNYATSPTGIEAGALGVGGIMGVALDLDNHVITFYPNCGAGTSYSINAGTWYPVITVQPYDNTHPAQIDANFGQNPFSCTVPAGFHPGYWQ